MGVAAEPPDRAEPEALSPSQRQALIRALSQWAQRHPEPNRPFWGLASYEQATGEVFDDMLTPRELVEAVEGETYVGQRFMHGVGIVLTEISFDDYLRSIDRSATRPGLVEAFLSVRDWVLRLVGRSRGPRLKS